ncbi:hypothetical protein [Komagataeibacter sp. FNDCR2]|uniref:hypothetical protein n=1 Tax=Komagataeibacter sp. FNDCR2 TaxID=2878682 RepID=UPI001E5E180D|nr:hypothetical protein [Komagataeibacter sp. FNDCR2]MCE2574797.1 hypothetical protein [Komagataeibacter sp. FNDCR2]
MGTPDPIRRPDRFDAGKYLTRRATAVAISNATDPITEALDAFASKLSSDGSEYSGKSSGTLTGVFEGTVQIGTPPDSATATGAPGQIIFAASGIYLCTATNSWVCFVPGAWPTP